MATTAARLRDEGWSLAEQAVNELLEAECGSAQLPPPQALAALLDADLKQVGAPCLPDDINRADSKKLVGPMVLQVSAVSDVSQPSRASGDTERKGRILRLKLTDGRSSCVGIEFAPLPYSLEQLCPGTKVRLHNVTVRLGVLLLEPKCIEVLGGRVEALAEGWEVQQKYGGTATERTADAADADKPPPFRHFDPKMAKYGSRRGAVAAKSAQVAPAGGTTATAGVPQPAVPSQQVAPQQAGPQQQRQARRGFQPYQPPPSRQGKGDAAASQFATSQQQIQAQQQQEQQRGARRGEQQGRGEQQVRAQRQPRARSSAATTQPPPPPQPASTAPAAPPAPNVRPSAASAAPSASAQRLLDRLQMEEGRFGRGQRRGRRGRFRDDEEDDGALTLEEWEARQAARRTGAAAGGVGAAANGGSSNATTQQQQQLSDEELARQLQRQLDLEAAAEWGQQAGQQPEQDLAATLFTFDRPDSGGSGGRGRGRGRGGRGRGRGGGRGQGRH